MAKAKRPVEPVIEIEPDAPRQREMVVELGVQRCLQGPRRALVAARRLPRKLEVLLQVRDTAALVLIGTGDLDLDAPLHLDLHLELDPGH